MSAPALTLVTAKTKMCLQYWSKFQEVYLRMFPGVRRVLQTEARHAWVPDCAHSESSQVSWLHQAQEQRPGRSSNHRSTLFHSPGRHSRRYRRQVTNPLRHGFVNIFPLDSVLKRLTCLWSAFFMPNSTTQMTQ